MSNKQEHKRDLKPEQAAAAHTLDRHISVTAGPGAGKTTVLVERYLHILREHKELNIDQIVAITFTNRAANEMRERLRKDLDRVLQECAGDARQRWMRYKRTLDGAVITTIHGFCARLLREFPVEARIDPQFSLLDEHRAAMLLELAVEESLTEFINSSDESISRLTAGIGRAKLAAALVELYRTIRGQGLRLDDLSRQIVASHSTLEDYSAALAKLEACIADLLSLRGLSRAAEQKRNRATVDWPGVRAAIASVPPPTALDNYCAAIENFRSVRPDKSAAGSLSLALDELLWGNVKKRRNDYSGLVPQLCFDLFARQYALDLIDVLKSIDKRLAVKKQQLSALDFDDLQLQALKLLDHQQVLLRAAHRYRFFLVDEFQDTNGQQRDLLTRLTLKSGQRANLFIVGDRKQSIYGFRGADVNVFREMTAALIAASGKEESLLLNFRSQPPLIDFFNFLFARLFKPSDEVKEDLSQLGFVEHECSRAERKGRDAPPLVELLIDTKAAGDEDDPKTAQTSRERDAQQLAQRIISLVNAGSEYRNIALLFRAMTDVPTYESAFRRAGIPYQTVLGKGFYEREEIADLIQLLCFLDNRTDELALAAVLRSPMCGISDNALLALRLAPRVGETTAGQSPQSRRQPRKLFPALRRQSEIDFITADERAALSRAAEFLAALCERRNRYAIADLLRFAVEQSEYTTVIAATFDGAQRLANLQKLFTLAERFERSGAHLIRDFVQYVHDFETLGSREGEGQIDDSANTVKLMTIHQAKGLEFPVVIIPDLHRLSGTKDQWFILDRHCGLALRVPDGRGDQVAGRTFNKFNERAKLREQFEGMRLLYVAATRAEDRLILSGATDQLAKLNKGRDSWLKWIWQALELQGYSQSGVVDLGDHVQLQLTVNLIDQPDEVIKARATTASDTTAEKIDLDQPPAKLFPLLRSLEPERGRAVHRFSVTQLINYQRCPRQYYFDRVLHVPSSDKLAIWNDAEAPEPPANLTATLKGALIHRFCETFVAGEDPTARLRHSFNEVIRRRQAELAGRLADIDREKAIRELLPLAQNYLNSSVFQRVEAARQTSRGLNTAVPGNAVGLWSELSFRLRRPLGLLTGAIDKLLITRSDDGVLEIEIVDFKTNRLGARTRGVLGGAERGPRPSILAEVPDPLGCSSRPQSAEGARARPASAGTAQQIAFDFTEPAPQKRAEVDSESIHEAVRRVASDYQLQMQAYTLAARELLPSPTDIDRPIKVTLHFLDPNVEFHLSEELLESATCAQAIDDAMFAIISAREPEHFPVRPALHCRMCSFLDLCPSGRQWLRRNKN